MVFQDYIKWRNLTGQVHQHMHVRLCSPHNSLRVYMAMTAAQGSSPAIQNLFGSDSDVLLPIRQRHRVGLPPLRHSNDFSDRGQLP